MIINKEGKRIFLKPENHQEIFDLGMLCKTMKNVGEITYKSESTTDLRDIPEMDYIVMNEDTLWNYLRQTIWYEK